MTPRLSLATPPLAEMVSMECGLETPSITFCMFFYANTQTKTFLFLGDFLAMGYEAELFGGATFSDRLLLDSNAHRRTAWTIKTKFPIFKIWELLISRYLS